MGFIGRMNKYIDETMPWYWLNLKMRMISACNLLCITWQALRIIAILVSLVL